LACDRATPIRLGEPQQPKRDPRNCEIALEPRPITFYSKAGIVISQFRRLFGVEHRLGTWSEGDTDNWIGQYSFLRQLRLPQEPLMVRVFPAVRQTRPAPAGQLGIERFENACVLRAPKPRMSVAERGWY
jgi:hypothetical protein